MRWLVGILLLLPSLCLGGQGMTLVGGGKGYAGGGGGGSDTGFVDHIHTRATTSPLVTSGSLLVNASGTIVCFTGHVASSVTGDTVTCGGSNSLTKVGGNVYPGGGPYNLQAWIKSGAASYNNTCTFTPAETAGTYRFISCGSYNGNWDLDQYSCNTVGCSGVAASSVNFTSQNITTTENNELLVGFVAPWTTAGTVYQAVGAYNFRGTNTVKQAYFDAAVSSTGSYPGGNFGSTDAASDYLSMFVTLKPAAAGGGTIAQVAAVPSLVDETPSYTFSSDAEGAITYGGACGNADLSTASIGNNTVTWNLANGTYSNCTIRVGDSNTLSVPSFVSTHHRPIVFVHGLGGSGTTAWPEAKAYLQAAGWNPSLFITNSIQENNDVLCTSTNPPTTDPTSQTEEVAQWVADALVDFPGFDQVDMVGHSRGGQNIMRGLWHPGYIDATKVRHVVTLAGMNKNATCDQYYPAIPDDETPGTASYSSYYSDGAGDCDPTNYAHAYIEGAYMRNFYPLCHAEMKTDTAAGGPLEFMKNSLLGLYGSNSAILNDTLYAASDTAIASYTVAPGPGGTWSLLGAQGLTVGPDGARAGGANSSTAITSDVMTDGYVEVIGTTGNATSGVYFAPGRINSSNNGYAAFLLGNGSFGIYEIAGGTPTLNGGLISLTIPSITTPIRVRLTFSGATIHAEAWDGDTSLGTKQITDSTYSSGSPAMRINATAGRVTQITAGN